MYRRLFQILWLCFTCLVFWTSYCNYKNEPKYFYLRQIIGFGLCLSRGSASVINVCCFLIIVPMCRFISASIQIVGSKISSRFISMWGAFTKNFHISCALTILLASVFHSFAHIMNAWNFSRFHNAKLGGINFAKTKGEDPLLMMIVTVPGFTGVLMMLILCILSSSSSKYLRSSNYDLFWFSHHLFVIFLLLLLCHPLSGILKEQSNLLMHPPGCNTNYSSQPAQNCTKEPVFVPQTTHTWKWVVAALLLYVVDISYKILCGVKPVQILSTQSFSCDLFSLTLLKPGFTARPGQFIFLQCHNISTLEWHPFTISKCPTKADPSFSVHIRAKGDWSSRLQNHTCFGIAENESSFYIPCPLRPLPFSVVTKTRICIDGPYGSCMENVLKHSVSICIAGGIGITPFAAILNFLRVGCDDSFTLKRLHLLWICKEIETFCCFSTLMSEVSRKSWNSNKPDMFDFQFYLTRYHGIQNIKKTLGNSFPFIKPRLIHGRPVFHSLFKNWAKNYKRCRAGIFCCGPKSLNDEVEKILNSDVLKNHRFSFYHELFS